MPQRPPPKAQPPPAEQAVTLSAPVSREPFADDRMVDVADIPVKPPPAVKQRPPYLPAYDDPNREGKAYGPPPVAKAVITAAPGPKAPADTTAVVPQHALQRPSVYPKQYWDLTRWNWHTRRWGMWSEGNWNAERRQWE